MVFLKIKYQKVNLCKYIGVIFGCLVITACAGSIVKDNVLPEDLAIELAKKFIVLENKIDGATISVQDAILKWEKEPEFTSVGWEATDVDESTYFVVFKYEVNNIKQLWAFHVVTDENIVERIELGDDGLDGHRYMSRIIRTSSYSRDELQVKLKKVFEELIFQ